MTFGGSTLSIMVAEATKVLNRINQDNFSSQYYLRETTQEFTVNVRHTQEGPLADGTRFDRHNVELIHTVFPTETSAGQTRTAYVVFRNKRSDDYAAVEDTDAALASLIGEAGAINELLSWIS